MATYYFTYGLGEDTNQAYSRGWTEVEAEDARQAVDLYKAFHPLTEDALRTYQHAAKREVF